MTTEELNQYNQLSKAIIGAAIEVHKVLGPGLLESVYEVCLVKELKDLGFKATPQVDIPLYYKGEVLDKNFRIDILVEDKVIIELKSTEKLLPIHEVQLVTYLKLARMKLGILINFNVPLLKDGIKRRING